VMGGAQAASVLSTVKGEMSAEDKAKFEAPILAKYEREGSPYYSTARLWDDGIIDPLDTRHVISLGLNAAANAPLPPTHFGIFRM
jgi:3-methylcrotonyl-CoA carboxylase beta subunit